MSLYEMEVRAIDGAPVALNVYAGRVLLIVNTASACGLTPQYEPLERVYETYRARGLEVLAFPANEFGAQEPGSNAEIAEFCSSKFGVKFPLFEKIVVKGPDIHPLYRELIAAQPTARGDIAAFRADLANYGYESGAPSDITWNFEKFLVDRRGNVIARFAPDIAPDDPQIIAAIEAALASPA